MSHRGTLEGIETRARALIDFADGMEDAGLEGAARRSRAVARDALDLAGQLATERAARVSMQAARDRCLALLLKRETRAA